MKLMSEVHERMLTELLEGPGKLYRPPEIAGPYGMLVRAPGGKVEYQICSQATFFENVPDFPRERVGPDWLLVAVGDDAGSTLFVYPWEMVKDVVE